MNDTRQKTIIQKYGGSSVGKAVSRTAVLRHIMRSMEEGYRPVVVVSAMGRNGDPYATDTLLALYQAAGGAVGREQDLLLSCGEVISAVVLAQSLQSEGLPSIALTGAQAGIVTDDRFGHATVLTVRPDCVVEALNQGRIPVVAGFQGATVGGDITTLGRGGSDTTAAVLGVALAAELIEIYTDVDGMKTADPRIVPEAVTLERITYTEAIEMAYLGAAVIHPRAVQVAMASRIPLIIRGTDSSTSGTLVTSGLASGPDSVVFADRPVTGITHVADQMHVQVRTNGKAQIGLDLFDGLAQAGVSLDMVHVSQDRTAFTLAGNQADEAEQVLSRLGAEYTLDPGFAKVSAVGGGMHGVPGIVSRVFRALSAVAVEVHETSDSHANISCLVRQVDTEKAVKALHKEFRLMEGQRAFSERNHSVPL